MKSLNRLIYGAEVYGEEETKFRCARARARNSKTVWTVAGPGPYRAGRLSVWCGADWRTGHIILIGLAAAGPHSLFLIKISVAARFLLRLPKKVSQLENSKTRDTSKPDALSPAATSQNHCLWTSIGMQRGPLLTRRCQEGGFLPFGLCPRLVFCVTDLSSPMFRRSIATPVNEPRFAYLCALPCAKGQLDYIVRVEEKPNGLDSQSNPPRRRASSYVGGTKTDIHSVFFVPFLICECCAHHSILSYHRVQPLFRTLKQVMSCCRKCTSRR